MKPADPSKNLTAWQLACRDGMAAARHHRWPALFLWIFGMSIIMGYFFVAPVHDGLERIGRLKTEWGWVFSAISTSIFGGIVPVLITRYTNRSSAVGKNLGFGWLASNACFWALKGIEVDFWYRLQALVFGTDPVPGTIIAKTLTDQLIYVPTIGLVNVILFYHWRECGYSFVRFQRTLGKKWYGRRILPVLISNWGVWIPAVVLIYCLPLPLQLPVQNLILCFWVLLLAFFANPPSE